MTNNEVWSREDIDYLLEVWPDRSNSSADIAKKLNRTRRQVRTKAAWFGVTRDVGWTREEDAILIKNWRQGGCTIREVAAMLGRPVGGARSRARRLGLVWHC